MFEHDLFDDVHMDFGHPDHDSTGNDEFDALMNESNTALHEINEAEHDVFNAENELHRQLGLPEYNGNMQHDLRAEVDSVMIITDRAEAGDQRASDLLHNWEQNTKTDIVRIETQRELDAITPPRV